MLVVVRFLWCLISCVTASSLTLRVQKIVVDICHSHQRIFLLLLCCCICSSGFFSTSLPCGAKYCNELVCVSVCLFCLLVYLKTTYPNFTKFSVYTRYTGGRGLVLFWQKYNTLCASGFDDDVMLGQNQRQRYVCPVRQMAALGAKLTFTIAGLLLSDVTSIPIKNHTFTFVLARGSTWTDFDDMHFGFVSET